MSWSRLSGGKEILSTTQVEEKSVREVYLLTREDSQQFQRKARKLMSGDKKQNKTNRP